MTWFQSMAISVGGDAEHGDLAAVAHVAEHVAEGGGVAGHLEADVEAFVHAAARVCTSLSVVAARIDGEGDADFFGQGAAVGVGIGDDDVAGAGVAGDGRGHDADGTGSGDEDVLAEHREGERGVDGVAEGVEDGGDSSEMPGACCQMLDMGRTMNSANAPLRLTPTPMRVGAEVAAAGEAVAAASADDVTFAGDDLADGEIGDVGADGDDLADELVADGEADGDGGAGPGVPVVDVEVGAADAGVEDANLYVVDADLGLGNVFEPEAAFGAAFYECLHSVRSLPARLPGRFSAVPHAKPLF